MEVAIDIEDVTSKIKAATKRALKEEDVKIGIESILKDVAEKFGLSPASYEYTFVTGGRADALYGQVIIEYESPEALSNKSKRESSVAQLKEYISKHAKSEENYHKYLGISIDGQNILFVRYNDRDKGWFVRGPFPINVETVGRLLEALRGLKRKALDVDVMLLDFGPGSDIAKKVIQQLYNSTMRSSRSKVLFDDWRRVFKQVAAYSPEKVKGLETVYGISGKIDYEKLLFCIHTYFAFIMKLIAAEVVVLYGGGKFVRSYFSELIEAHLSGKLKDKLKEIEEGIVFSKFLNLENFMEADYFSWYIDEWNDELSKSLGYVIKLLSDYEVGTTDLEPERVRDLFKRLYQNLMPKNIRHDMGEYYTPDWLAELLLDEVGFKTTNFERMNRQEKDEHLPLQLRLLDPACGSGTFLVLAIKRVKDYADQHYIDSALLVKHILKNIVGFDLNPLAVIAARTNYLLALGDLLRFVATRVELPIFLADSIMVERRSTLDTLTGESYILRTAVGEFQIPSSLVEKAILAKVLDTISKYVNLEYTPKEFDVILRKEISDLDSDEVSLVTDLFRKFRKLEQEGKNRIWTGVLKNSFAPLYQSKFDYVVGNPPWISWETLPEEYRKSSMPLWSDYGLIVKTGGIALGKLKRDIAMLFTVVSLDKYLKDDGILGFLITFTMLRVSAGEGFRQFLANKTSVQVTHSLVDLKPFEGAHNITGLIVVRKGNIRFPIPSYLWRRFKGRQIEFNMNLREVEKACDKKLFCMFPIKHASSPWMTISKKAYEAVKKVFGSSNYRAYEGVNTALNGAYWVEILENRENTSLVQNFSDVGKKRVKKVKAFMEKEMIYPLVRGRDTKRYYGKPSAFMILPIENNGRIIDITAMRIKYPNAWSYFLELKQDLINRGGEPYKTQLKSWKEASKRAESRSEPFYTLFNVSPTLSPYKVAWKPYSGHISGKGRLEVSLIKPARDGKVAILDHSLMFIPTSSEEEALFLLGILNSSIMQLIVNSYSLETRITVNILEYVRIPEYNRNNRLHLRIVARAKEANALAERELINQLKSVEQDLDKLVAELYDITEQELAEIKESLTILMT